MRLVTIGHFDFITDAQIALGKLAANGIGAQLADQHLVQTDWLYSLAVGGIKLQVDELHVERAMRVLEEDLSDVVDQLDQDAQANPDRRP